MTAHSFIIVNDNAAARARGHLPRGPIVDEEYFVSGYLECSNLAGLVLGENQVINGYILPID